MWLYPRGESQKMTDIVRARNTHRAQVLVDGDMSQDLVSKTIDFREMAIGSIQSHWEGNDEFDGELHFYGSNYPDQFFSKLSCGYHVMDEDGSDAYDNAKCHIPNLGVIGYRYMRVLYKKGSNTAGTLNIICIGKKNG